MRACRARSVSFSRSLALDMGLSGCTLADFRAFLLVFCASWRGVLASVPAGDACKAEEVGRSGLGGVIL